MTEIYNIETIDKSPTKEIDAITHAMRKSVDILIENEATIYSPRDIGYHELDTKEILENSTSNFCRQAAEYVGYELGKNYHDVFKEVYLLEGRPKDTGFRRDINDAGWSYHYYVVVKGEKFYACSPSNYYAEDKKNPLNRIIVSDTLKELLAEIELEEDGDWDAQKLDTQWDESNNPYKTGDLEKKQKNENIRKMIEYFESEE